MSSRWQLIGHDNIVSFLTHSLSAGSFSHAYLLSAPEHSGKTAMALKLAQTLNCVELMPGMRPCGECQQCLRIAHGQHTDVQVINVVASADEGKNRVELSIEQIRGIIHAASMPPYEGKYRVFIIEEAEKLSHGAANALLKTLEEPPPQVIFVLTTARENMLPETVRSRCLRLSLTATSRHDIMVFLEDELGLSADQAGLLSRLSTGRPGWAIMAANDVTVLNERRDNLDQFIGIMGAGYDRRFEIASKLAQHFSQKREEIYRLLEQWLSFARDLLLQKLDITDGIANTDYITTIDNLAKNIEIIDVRSLIGSIAATRRYLEQNANSRLALEVLMLGLPLFRGSLNKIG
ncbi:DNA polymerase III subunits gamma and tau [Dehalogenimonas sp. WBC-2]|nr:DNA polymerase III subunits gamma and tau [Dehalogenimonas sp. WBC-2]